MKLSFNKICDKFVFFNLKKIKHGYLEIIYTNEKKYSFGDNKSQLRAKLKILEPGFSYKLIIDI